MRTAGAVFIATFAWLLALSPPSGATTQAARSGKVSATFSFQGRFPNFSHLRLEITRNGVVAYDQPVTSRDCSPGCGPVLDPRESSVRVVDLESDGEPDVVVMLSAFGGARCCLVAQVFSFDPAAQTYVLSQHNFTATGVGASIEDLGHDGRLEFLSSDPWFFGAFADLAGSAEPIQIWIFRELRFIDVTCQYPKLIAHDAAALLRGFKREGSSGTGYLAAWAGDQDRLGHQKRVGRLLARALRHENLSDTRFRSASDFIQGLNRFLHNHRYLPPCSTA